MPHGVLLNLDARFKLTTPSGKYPMTVHVMINEKVMNEYDVSDVFCIGKQKMKTVSLPMILVRNKFSRKILAYYTEL